MDHFSLSGSEPFSSRFYRMNWQTPTNRRIFIVRAILMIFCTSFTMMNATTAMILPDNNVECLWDGIHYATGSLNSVLSEDSYLNDTLIGISSGLVDALLLYSCIFWTSFGKSWRPAIAVSLFYISRCVIQNLFLARKPDSYTWEYPGFPSITASYKDSNDFFFACSCGLMTIFALEYNRNKLKIPMAFCIFVGVLNGVVLLTTRAHYSVDIFAGVVFGHYFWMLSDRISGFIDKKLGRRYDSSYKAYSINKTDTENTH